MLRAACSRFGALVVCAGRLGVMRRKYVNKRSSTGIDRSHVIKFVITCNNNNNNNNNMYTGVFDTAMSY